MSRARFSGNDPLVLMLMEPRAVALRMRRMASASSRARVSGSPSQPWPKETMVRPGAPARWAAPMRAMLSTSGARARRWCDAGGPSSGCSEMQPTQRALHPELAGMAPSSRR